MFVQNVGLGQIETAVDFHYGSTPFPNESGHYSWMKTIAQ
jgi:hypothetical protein